MRVCEPSHVFTHLLFLLYYGTLHSYTHTYMYMYTHPYTVLYSLNHSLFLSHTLPHTLTRTHTHTHTHTLTRSVYHYMAHISNSLWCIHKSHHYAVTQGCGDGNTISIIEFAVAWIPLTPFVDPTSEVCVCVCSGVCVCGVVCSVSVLELVCEVQYNAINRKSLINNNKPSQTLISHTLSHTHTLIFTLSLSPYTYTHAHTHTHIDRPSLPARARRYGRARLQKGRLSPTAPLVPQHQRHYPCAGYVCVCMCILCSVAM
jgi:hypothetical protein